MQKEIFFDVLTALEVSQRLERLKVLDAERQEHIAAVNMIVLTTGRMSGCNPTDGLGLNAGGTGVVVASASAPSLLERGRSRARVL